MLSILIPEHNYNCTKLVYDLAGQCEKAGIIFEIIVLDNGSTLHKEENRAISEISGCLFVESEENAGLAKSRNRLVMMAKYPHFLMIDSDAIIVDKDFVRRYLLVMDKAQVVFGSMCYSQQKPSMDRCLRWYYGKKRENRLAAERNKNPYHSLITFNFMMEREIILRFPFEEQFENSYGHDDTVMGHTLKQNNIKVLHIDNPVIHGGLDLNEIFLAKSLKAAEKYFTYPVFQSKELVEEIKIYKTFEKVRDLGLCRIIAFKYRVAKKAIVHNLCGNHPSLFLFDFYRLGHMCDYFLDSKKRY